MFKDSEKEHEWVTRQGRPWKQPTQHVTAAVATISCGLLCAQPNAESLPEIISFKPDLKPTPTFHDKVMAGLGNTLRV